MMPKSFIINKAVTQSVIITLFVLIFGLGAYAQNGTIGSGNSPAINGQGRPLGGINVAVCIHPATGGYPCNNPATIYTDSTFSVTSSANPTTTDPQGNWGFFVTGGYWDVQFYAAGITSKTETVFSNGSGGPFNPSSLDGIIFVDGVTYSKADIFAGANAAAVAAGSPGQVVIPPGSYSTGTTLNCKDNLTFMAYGATITYTGAAIAIKCGNIEHGGIKGMKLLGPGTGGSTVGLQVGVGSGGTGIPTQYNNFDDLDIRNFNLGVKVDGYALNGTYDNTFFHVFANANNSDWSIVPTTANYANKNHYLASSALGAVGDGWKIDGSNGNDFVGVRAELSGGWGFNFVGTQVTNANTLEGVWGEANTSGDFNSGSAANVAQTTIKGGFLTSSPNFSMTGWNGAGNEIDIQARRDSYIAGGNPRTQHFISTSVNTYPILQNDHTSPPSGIIGVLAYDVTGSNAGHLYAGTPEFPFVARSQVLLNAYTVSALPSAASSTGAVAYVTDSTAVASEGQTCVGSSTNKALAFSNGTVWKCF